MKEITVKKLRVGDVIYSHTSKPSSDYSKVVRKFWRRDAKVYEVHQWNQRWGLTATTYPPDRVLTIVDDT